MAPTTNIRAFDLALEAYEKRVLPQKIKDRVTVLALTATKGVVELTPVDRGRAKGNWQLTLDTPAEGTVEVLDPTPQGTSGSSPVVSDVFARMKDWRIGQTVWLHNGLPYIRILNDGATNRTAHHMVERTVERIRRMLGSAS